MLVEAIVGWLVSWLGTRGLLVGKGLFLKTRERRIIGKAVAAAVDNVVSNAPIGAHEHLRQAFRNQVHALPRFEVDASISIRAQFTAALRLALLPLTEPSTPGRPSLLDQIGVEPEWLLDKFPASVIRAIEQLAVGSAFLGPLVARLDADAAQFEIAALRQKITSASPATVNSLPRRVSDFVGRDAELRALCAQLSTPGNIQRQMVYMVDGIPGIGKTALVVEAAHRLAGDYPDAQLFIDLHAHTEGQRPVDPADALEALLNVIGVPRDQIPLSLVGRAAKWRAQTTGKRMLLVLDNVASQQQVQPLLPGTAQCLVLLTGRRRMTGLRDISAITLEAIPVKHSIELFRRISGHQFDGDTATIGRIVEICGRLPLALHLVAGRLRHRPGWKIADLEIRLTAGSSRLSAMGSADRTVRTAFQISYDDLRNEVRSIFRLIGLHPGTDFSVEAAAALAGRSRESAIRILDELVDEGLLTEPRPGRYQLHDLLYDYASTLTSEIDSDSERTEAVDRLLNYYGTTLVAVNRVLDPGMLLTIEPSLSPGDTPALNSPQQARNWLDDERASLIGLARYVIGNNIEIHLFAFLDLLGTHLTSLGYVGQSLSLYDEALKVARQLVGRQREAGALLGRARVAVSTSRYPEAAEDYWLAHAIYQALDSTLGTAEALGGIGMIERLTGRHTHALEHYKEAYARFLQAGDNERASLALREVGRIEQIMGRYTDALAHLRTALEMSRTAGSRRGEASAMRGIAQVREAEAKYDEALSAHKHSLGIYRTIGLRIGELDALRGIGDCVRQLDRDDLALAHYEQAMTIAREIQDRSGEGYVSKSIGDLEVKFGRFSEAIKHYRNALAIAEAHGELPAAAYCWLGIAQAEEAACNTSQALSAWRRAFELFGALDMPESALAREALERLGATLNNRE